jgi:hypothetical protein
MDEYLELKTSLCDETNIRSGHTQEIDNNVRVFLTTNIEFSRQICTHKILH